MPERSRTIGYICPVCGKAVIASRTEFQLTAADSRIPCPCGKSELVLLQRGEHCRITVPCLHCAKDHSVTCGNDTLFSRDLISLACTASGLDCCYIGEEKRVFQAMDQLEQAMDKMVMDDQAGQRGAFLDDIVMSEVLGEVREIASRGGIRCECGSRDYGIRIGYSNVDLVCARCGAVLRLKAATPDDIDAVCMKVTLSIPGKKEKKIEPVF